MKKIIISSESSCDLPKDWLDRYDIKIVPFSINFPDRTVLDNEIPVEEIYDFYEKTKKIPKTNAVSPYQYTEFFEELAKANPECEILHIGYSSACSCSFQNAVIGVKDCKHAGIVLVDSKNVSGGLGNLVVMAARLREAHPQASAAELAVLVEPLVAKVRTSFVPDRLDFLLAGGRVSNAAALGAALFRIKPRIDIIDGQLIASKKYMGIMSKVVPQLVHDFTAGKKFDLDMAYVFYSTGAKETTVAKVKECLEEKGFKKIEVLHLGCVMTVHGGKAAIGLSATEL